MITTWSQELPAAWFDYLVEGTKDGYTDQQLLDIDKWTPDQSVCERASEPFTGSWRGVSTEMRSFCFRYEGPGSPSRHWPSQLGQP